MQELKVIENNLVPVYETSNGEKVVYGSELHEVLEVKSKFADWIKNRLNDCDAAEKEDFETFSKILEKGRPTNNPRPNKLSIRISDEDKKILEDYCERENINRTEAISRGIKKLDKK